MKKYLVEVMIIIMIIFIAFWAYVKVTITDEVIVPYEPYKPFGIIVDETTWNGKLEPGRYTKSGIKIIKQ